MELAAILVSPTHPAGPPGDPSPNGANGRSGSEAALRTLMARLGTVGVAVTVVDELAGAVEASLRHALPPAVLLDLRDAAAGEVEDQQAASEAIRRTLAQLPSALPIVITSEADPMLIISCIRAGAADVIDLQLEGTAGARAIVQRVCERQAGRAAELTRSAAQRDLIEDLVKDLIRTERRVIDAEHALARDRSTGDADAALDTRAPVVLLIEHERPVADQLADMLEDAGVATFAYLTGEEALREVDALARVSGLDLALVASKLPGIDGFETVRQLRARLQNLPALLLTRDDDGDIAALAADLGVTGFVPKPLNDVDGIVIRLAQLAHDSLHRTREHVYLQRIKERHERVLARYRTLPREP